MRALVRNPKGNPGTSSPEGRAELVAADIDSPLSLRLALGDTAGVFAMTTFRGPRGPQGEVEHGRVIGAVGA